MRRLESDFEKEVVKWVEAQGGKALKLKEDGVRGFPDRTIILPDGFIAFAELKRAGERSKKYHTQKLKVAWLKSMGLPAAFCETMDDVERLCQ